MFSVWILIETLLRAAFGGGLLGDGKDDAIPNWTLHDLPSEEDGVFSSRKVTLTNDALREFERFRLHVHVQRGLLDGREREWMDNGPSHVLRLAGTLAYLDWAAAGGLEPSRIEAKFVADAVRLIGDYFWPHSRAALRQIGLSERHADARRILKWIRVQKKYESSREEIRRDALGQKLDAEATQKLLESLCDPGRWCRPVPSVSGKGGGRPRQRWEFNPQLFRPTAETAETAETVKLHATGHEAPHHITRRKEDSAVSAVSASNNVPVSGNLPSPLEEGFYEEIEL